MITNPLLSSIYSITGESAISLLMMTPLHMCTLRCIIYSHLIFKPTALKGSRGIAFTYGVRMGGRQEKVCAGCISDTIRCRKLILGRDIGWGV